MTIFPCLALLLPLVEVAVRREKIVILTIKKTWVWPSLPSDVNMTVILLLLLFFSSSLGQNLRIGLTQACPMTQIYQNKKYILVHKTDKVPFFGRLLKFAYFYSFFFFVFVFFSFQLLVTCEAVNNCSGSGKCVRVNTCDCKSGFKGSPDCSEG